MPPDPQPSPAPEGAVRHRAAAQSGWAERLRGVGPVIGLALLCVAGTLLNGDFATLDNAMNVLTRTAFIGIIAVGMCFVIISGGIDLSVGSMAALIAGSVIMFINWAGPATGSPLTAVVLDEPTRGVDVGAKRDIYFLIQRMAREGLAVIVVSSELMELIGLCHRVAVMRAGRLVTTLDADHLTEEELIAHATGPATVASA